MGATTASMPHADGLRWSSALADLTESALSGQRLTRPGPDRGGPSELHPGSPCPHFAHIVPVLRGIWRDQQMLVLAAQIGFLRPDLVAAQNHDFF